MNMKHLHIVILFLILVFLSAQARADRVILKDGGVVQGTVIEETGDTVLVEDIDGVQSVYEAEDIENIVISRGTVEDEDSDANEYELIPDMVIQDGHDGGVFELSFSPNSEFLATGGGDKEIKIWQTETGELFREIRPPDWGGLTTSLKYSSDGDMIAASGMSESLRIFSSETGELIESLTPDKDNMIWEVAFCPDDTCIAAGTINTIYILSLETHDIEHKFILGEEQSVQTMFFSPDGEYFIVAADESIRIWSLESEELIHDIEGFSASIHVTYSPDGEYLAVCNKNGLRLFSMKSGEEEYSIATDSTNGCEFTPKGDRIITGNNNGDVRILMVDNGEAVFWMNVTNNGEPVVIDDIVMSPDEQYLAWDQAGLSNSPFYLYSFDNEEQDSWNMFTIDGQSDVIGSLAFDPNNSLLAFTDSRKIAVWSLDSGQLEWGLIGGGRPNESVAFSPDGALMAFGGHEQIINWWDVETWRSLGQSPMHDDTVRQLLFSPDGRYLVSTERGQFIFWSVETGEKLFYGKLSGDESTPVRWYSGIPMAFDSAGEIFAFADSSEEEVLINIFSMISHEIVSTINTGLSFIQSFALSPNGKTIAIAEGINGAPMEIVDIDTGEPIQTVLAEEGDDIVAIEFTADGKQIITTTWNGLINICSIENGESINRIETGESWVSSIAFFEEQQLAFTGGFDRHIKVINIDTGQILAKLVSFDDGNWFVQDSAGRFDCSGCTTGDPNSGKKYIRWRVGNKLYAPDQFFRKYFEPGLLADVVKMGYVPPIEDMGTALATPPPDVAITGVEDGVTTSETEVNVNVEVKEYEDGGAENIRLFVNGRPVSEPPRDVTPSDTPESDHIYEFTAPLLPGENTLMALATSRSGIDSRQAQITVTSTQPAEKPDLYMVTVGINKYAEPYLNLNLAVDDADGFADVITQKGEALYSEIHDIRLRDQDATAGKLRETLKEIQDKATFNDVVIIFYAGHGTNKGEGWYLLTHEITDTGKKFVTENAFSDLELKAFLKRVNAGKVILVMDACYSGAVPQMLAHGISKDKFLVQLAYGTGTSVMAASTDAQAAWESGSDLGHGVFTYYLLDGMAGKADGVVDGKTSNTVEVTELGEYTRTKVPEYTKETFDEMQEPFFWQVAGSSSLGPSLVTVGD